MTRDPRAQPFAYITDGKRLGEVIQQKGSDMIVEDARTLERFQVSASMIREKWRVIREAPATAPNWMAEA